MNRKERKLLLNFVNKSRKLFSECLSFTDDDADWNMISFLMQQHFDNKIVTINSLIQASGIPFTSALRRVNLLVEKKLFLKRAKTSTGKSFSIHPSEKLINDFFEFLILIKESLAENLGFEDNSMTSKFHFGMSLHAGNLIPPPHALIHSGKILKTITIATNNNPTFKVIEKNIKFFENIIGSKINLKIFGLNELHNEILKNKKNKNSAFDIIAFNIPWLGELCDDNILLPLDKYISEINLNLSDFHAPTIESGTINNQIYGIPIEMVTSILFLRNDIINKYNLKPPQTFKNLLEISQFLSNKKITESVISWPAKRGVELGSFFLETMANFGQPYVDLRSRESNFYDLNNTQVQLRPMFNSNEAAKSANFLKQLVKYSPKNVSSMSYDQCANYYAEGKSSMMFNWSSRASIFEHDTNSPAYLNTGYYPRPEGKNNFQISSMGGFLFGIPKNINQSKIDFCVKVIKHLVSPQLIKYFIEQGSLSCPLFSVSNDDEIKQISPLFESLKLMDIESKIFNWPRAPIPQYSDITNIVGNEIFKYLFLDQNIKVTLEKCQNESTKIFNII